MSQEYAIVNQYIRRTRSASELPPPPPPLRQNSNTTTKTKLKRADNTREYCLIVRKKLRLYPFSR